MTTSKRRDGGRKFDIGDLVAILSDDTIVYVVGGFAEITDSDGYQYYQYEVYPCEGLNEGWTEFVYEDDISLLARAEDAETYLRMRRNLRTPREPLSVDDMLDDLSSFIKMRDRYEAGPIRDMFDAMISDTKALLHKKVTTHFSRDRM